MGVGGGDDMGRICVFWQRCLRLRRNQGRRGGDCRPQVGSCLENNVPVQISDKSSTDNGTIVISNISIGYDMVDAHGRRARAKTGQARRKKEEINALVKIKLDDLRKNRKGRVVQNQAAGRICIRLIVPARIKRADDAGWVDVVPIAHPVKDRVIDQRRGVAVVGRFFGLELIDKSVILGVIGK